MKTMDKISSIPTDSLYKFMSIFGLVLFLYGGFYFYKTSSENLIIAEENLIHKNIKLSKKNYYYGNLISSQNKIINISKILNVGLKCNVTDTLIECNYPTVLINGDYYRHMLYTEIDEFESNRAMYEQLTSEIELVELKNEIADLYKPINKLITYIIILSGEIIMLIGFALWYGKVQSPIDLETKNKRTLEGKVYRICQSCSKSIYENIDRGSNSDKSLNYLYCKECFSDGKFTDPELDFTVAKERFIVRLNGSKNNRLNKMNLRMNFKNLTRWRKQRYL